MRFLILIIPALLCFNPSTAQIFDWYDDGFTVSQTSYYNIDGSGIDVKFSGMETGSAYPPLFTNYNWLKVGIDNNDSKGIQHKYVIRFSETVDVEFEIKNINRDTSGGFCYNDQLILPDAIILYSGRIYATVDDTVFASYGSYPSTAGYLRLRYKDIDSVTIYHGEGMGCNPGHIFISPLYINDNVLGIDEQLPTKEKELVRITDLMGRETEERSNTVLIYFYSDGTTEKVYRME